MAEPSSKMRRAWLKIASWARMVAQPGPTMGTLLAWAYASISAKTASRGARRSEMYCSRAGRMIMVLTLKYAGEDFLHILQLPVHGEGGFQLILTDDLPDPRIGLDGGPEVAFLLPGFHRMSPHQSLGIFAVHAAGREI